MVLEQSSMRRWTIEGNSPSPVEPSKGDYRSYRMAQMGLIAIAMIDIAFGFHGHYASLPHNFHVRVAERTHQNLRGCQISTGSIAAR
jgi:hypothetical protein